jgi:sugar phosphate isomerase/epimerase
MQSIWYGRRENIFSSDKDRAVLIEYTKKAVLFAEALHCPNLVFGCPRNRNMPAPDMLPAAIAFFTEIGQYALEHHTVIALEPNPPYYQTNFINTTAEAFALCTAVHNPGLKVNVDLGTAIHYNESLDFINAHSALIQHIHISEPLLAPIERRDIHRELKSLNYNRYFSIEMKNTDNVEQVKNTIRYIKEAVS